MARRLARGVLAAAALAALALVAMKRCAISPRPTSTPAALAPLAAARATPTSPPPSAIMASNVDRADYVGPAACADCHADQAARWRTSLHPTMNQLATPAAIVGDFDGAPTPSRPGWRGPPATAYARAGDRRALPALVEVLDDPQASARMWLLFAVESLLDRRLTRGEYAPLAPPATRRRQLTTLRALAARAR